jgi:phosphatidylglycerophosphatase C
VDPHRPLAVFDLDGTLVRGDSFLPFAVGYARARRRLRPLVTLPVWVGLYAARLLPDHRAKQRVLVSFFRGECPAAVADYAEAFVERWVRPRLLGPVSERLTGHLSAGHRVVLLSASPDLYVETVGRALGIGEVVCTRVRRTAAAWDGALDGPNCKGEQKLVRLCAHLGRGDWPTETFAYGD